MVEHDNRIIIVGNIMSPIPTKGETNPPKRNPDAPKIAEAEPVNFLPDSIAMVEAEVNINPSSNSMANVNPS